MRIVDDRRVYLTTAGAIGADDIGVQLDGSLARYALPPKPQNVREAFSKSLQLLNVGEPRVMFPHWAAAYLAPLAEILPVDFVLWSEGPTGSLKSALAALSMCHYGNFDRLSLPANFSDSANALEKLLFSAKDALVVIDDFAPQNDPFAAREIESKA